MEPHAHLSGKTPKANQARAVLREALQWYGRRPSPTLNGFLAMLADLPDGVSIIANARDRAGELSQNLRAAMVNDPLFGGEGTPADPGSLLTPSPGYRARVSVISMRRAGRRATARRLRQPAPDGAVRLDQAPSRG